MDPASTLAWVEDHALGVAGRARREHELEDVGGRRAGPRRQLRLPVGREGVVRVGGQVLDDRGGEALEPDLARVGGVAAAAEEQADWRPTRRRSGRPCPGPSARRAGRTRAARTSRRSTRRGARASTGDQVSTRSPGWSPSALSRQAAIRLRRRTSAYVQCHVDPSSVRSPSACFGPNRRGGVLEQVDDGLHGRLILAGRATAGRAGGACAGGWTAVCPRPRLPTRWSPSSGSPGRSSSGPTTSSPCWPWSSGSPSTGPTSGGGAGSMRGSPSVSLGVLLGGILGARAGHGLGEPRRHGPGDRRRARRCRTR